MKIKRKTKMNKGYEKENIIIKIKRRTKDMRMKICSQFFCVFHSK